MTLAAAQTWIAERAPDIPLIDGHASTATVADAAAALGVEPARIAKTLCLRSVTSTMLVITRGDARIDNRKFKAEFGGRPRMVGPDETLALTGHEPGGVCPFGLATPLPVYCDVSLKGFASVYPAAGSRTSSIQIAPERLADLVAAPWIDVCSLAEPRGS
jgi:prolyl-tRNA editing enzyme YbaK/EbsC (Cys-tRNA(Pro) deacylase)